MILFTRDQLEELQKIRLFPSISFYLPIQKEGAEIRQNPIRLRKMVKAAEDALHEKGLRTPQIDKLTEPVRELYDDAIFWSHQDESLALYFNETGLKIVKLPIAVDESATIADRFMIRPLLRLLGRDGQYNMVWLSLSDPKLFRCTRFDMDEQHLDNLPESLKAVLETYSQQKQLQHHSSSGKSGHAAGGSVYGSAESVKDLEKGRIEEYFRKIDNILRKELAEDHSPVVLVCVDYLAPIYHSVSRLPGLMAGHVSGAPDTLKRDVLMQQAWKIVQPAFEADKASALATCQNLMSTPRVIEDIRLILPAALHRQIDTLFLLRGAAAYGHSDPGSGRVILTEERQPEFGEEELFDQAAMQTLQHGGKVYILEKGEMPEQADCLAVLRYEFASLA